MTNSGDDSVDRLRRIWEAWGLEPGAAEAESQQKALALAESWLGQGTSDPEVAIRAVQLLLLDPERPDCHKRRCWDPLKKALRDTWHNVGTSASHVQFGQALVLASWSNAIPTPLRRIASLLDGPWDDVLRGREIHKNEICEWRQSNRAYTSTKQASQPSQGSTTKPLSRFGEPDLANATSSVQHIENNQNVAQFAPVGPHVVQALRTLASATIQISANLNKLSHEASSALATTSTNNKQLVKSLLSAYEDTLTLLWWGQARYSTTLQIPFRRFDKAHDVLWWAAWEAAELSQELDIEPAAAFLVEMLHALGHDVTVKRPLGEWMRDLHATLQHAAKAAPSVAARLHDIAEADAIGLPVTWLRIRAAKHESIEDAANAVGLDLGAPIDRGQWASWIFRESLLDLLLEGQ